MLHAERRRGRFIVQYNSQETPHFYQLISKSPRDFINLRELLTLSPQISSVIFLVIFPGFLKHFVNATFFECILLTFRVGRTTSSRATDR
jgi:hypothetical protein